MTRPPARTALLIGNGVFPQADGVLTPLAAPSHDVSVLAGLLADPEVCRFDAPQTLVDRDAQTIKKTLLRTLNSARPQDLVLVYYAGHGKLDGAQLYLCTHDTEPETLAATAVSIGDIREYVSRSPCKQVVLILDCCFSGAAADEFRTRGELSDRIEAAASARGLYLLTSCANYETSLEHVGSGEDDIPYGVYTRALADGILSGHADLYGDGRITPLELAKYLQSRIPGQTPRVSLIDAEGEEPVLAWTSWAQNDGERKRVRTRLAQWYAEETIPDEVFYQAMGLMGRVPQSVLERRRKRLLGMCAGAGWDDVFTRGWLALEPADGDAAGLERLLTEHAADGTLDGGFYLEAMRALASEPEGDLQQRRKRLLARFARSPDRDVSVLIEAWQALGRREPARPAEVSYAPSTRRDPEPPRVTAPPIFAPPAEAPAPESAAPPADEDPAPFPAEPSSNPVEAASAGREADELQPASTAELPAPAAEAAADAPAPVQADGGPDASADADATPADPAEPSAGAAAWASPLGAALARERRQLEQLEGRTAAFEANDADAPGLAGDPEPADPVPVDHGPGMVLDDGVEDLAGYVDQARLARELAPWELVELRELEAEEAADDARRAESGSGSAPWPPPAEPIRSVVQEAHGGGPGDRRPPGKRDFEYRSPLRGDLWFLGAVVLIGAIVFAVVVANRDRGYEYEDIATTQDTSVVTYPMDTTMAPAGLTSYALDTLGNASALPSSPSPVRTDETDFPAYGEMLERVRFSESADGASTGEADYGRRFATGATQFIWYDLLVTGIDSAVSTSARPWVHGVWYNPDGSRMGLDSVQVSPGAWTLRRGFGYDAFGNWPTGVYYLELLHQRQRVAMLAFEMLSGDTVSYDLVEVAGRVTDLRFYDPQRSTSEGFLPRTRFSGANAFALGTWLEFTHPTVADARDYPIEVVFYNASGRPVDHAKGTVPVNAGTTRSAVNLGTGIRTWERGLYRAEYFVYNTRIATGIFDVY